LLDFQNSTATTASPATTLLEAVTNSLAARGLIPEDKPVHSLPAQFTADRLAGIELVQKGDGWIGNVIFDMPFGDPDVLTTRENLVLPTRRAAFDHAAAIVVEVLTGVRELPFEYADRRPRYRTA
jgi:hypothetical protein